MYICKKFIGYYLDVCSSQVVLQTARYLPSFVIKMTRIPLKSQCTLENENSMKWKKVFFW